MALKAHALVYEKNILGEGPLWLPSCGRLIWTDILAHSLYSLCPESGELIRRDFPFYLACLGEAGAGGLIAAGGTGWLRFGSVLDPSSPELVEGVPYDAAAVRFNDGKIGPDGRFYAGTMDLNARDPLGALYVLSAAPAEDEAGGPARVRTLERGLTISNGLGWSPDGTTMYLTDSGVGTIYSYDFDACEGSISSRRVFVRDRDTPGDPDGLTVDAEGNVWSARWGGGAVICYDPRGREQARIEVPARHTTSCCFGGEDLDLLYITSARYGLAEPGEPDGALFVCACGSRGREPNKFGEAR